VPPAHPGCTSAWFVCSVNKQSPGKFRRHSAGSVHTLCCATVLNCPGSLSIKSTKTETSRQLDRCFSVRPIIGSPCISQCICLRTTQRRKRSCKSLQLYRSVHSTVFAFYRAQSLPTHRQRNTTPLCLHAIGRIYAIHLMQPKCIVYHAQRSLSSKMYRRNLQTPDTKL